jgi:broad specificity phosphatase PhoE
MKVTLLRHAESLFNKYLTSEKDCDLSQEGKDQAAALTGNYDVIILSSLRRSHQTLLYSQIQGKRIFISDLCREKRKDICDFLEIEDPTNLESDEELSLRIDSFKNYIRQIITPNESVLVIGHGEFIFTALGKTNYPENASFHEWIL